MRRTTYLKLGLGVAAIVTLLLSLWSGSSGVVPPVLASSSCSEADLNGSYSALYQGWNIVLTGNGPGALGREPYIGFAAVIVVNFDGNGGIDPSSGGAAQLGVFNRSVDVTSGFYEVLDNCTGTLTFFTSRGLTFEHRIHVVGSGEEYRFLRLQNPGLPVAILQFGTARRMDLTP